MKKDLFVVAVLSLALASCAGNNAKTTETQDSVEATEVVATPEVTEDVYIGDLPAADSAVAFITTLTLRSDNTVEEAQTTKEGNKEVGVRKGTYQLDGENLTLNFDGQEQKAVLRDGTITYLDADGNEAPLYKLSKIS